MCMQFLFLSVYNMFLCPLTSAKFHIRAAEKCRLREEHKGLRVKM